MLVISVRGIETIIGIALFQTPRSGKTRKIVIRKVVTSCFVLSRNAPAHGRDVAVITRGIARISIIIVKSLTKKRRSNGLNPRTDVIGIRAGQSGLLILFVRLVPLNKSSG